MANLNSEALNRLSEAVESLFPPVNNPALKPGLHLIPKSITATGLNSFVGMHDEPPGEVFGCRVLAHALVTVKATSVNELNDAVTEMTRALIAVDPTVLRQKGIYRITLDELGPVSENPTRELKFTVKYEYVQLPEDDGDKILEIPLNLNVSA